MYYRKYWRILCFLTFLIPVLSSCFREDVPIKPAGREVISINESIYNFQSFFDLATRQTVSSNPVDLWDLGFESSAGGHHIIINTGKLIGVYSSGSIDFDALISVPANAKWSFDKSDGNLDSTSLNGWLSPALIPVNEVFVLGINDGIKYSPWKKIVFTSLSAGSYSFHYSNLDGSEAGSFSIASNTTTGFVYFSFAGGGKQVVVEPPKNSWDLLFTQYSTILFTDEGVPTPYYVRGVLSNRNGVEAALDTLIGFNNLNRDDVNRLKFSSDLDAIGHNWKSVKVDGTSAIYGVRQNYTYIIKSYSGLYYKLRFTGFFNNEGSPGYPKFEINELR